MCKACAIGSKAVSSYYYNSAAAVVASAARWRCLILDVSCGVLGVGVTAQPISYVEYDIRPSEKIIASVGCCVRGVAGVE